MHNAQRSRNVSEQTRQQARQLRRESTSAEMILWQQLRAHQFNKLKFRRQHPIGNYIVDFCCVARGLVIEIDGDVHAGREQQDAQRTAALNQMGYRVIRFTNDQVHRNMTGVLEAIQAACEMAPPPPPPRWGGE